jgi:hypothetical protein
MIYCDFGGQLSTKLASINQKDLPCRFKPSIYELMLCVVPCFEKQIELIIGVGAEGCAYVMFAEESRRSSVGRELGFELEE